MGKHRKLYMEKIGELPYKWRFIARKIIEPKDGFSGMPC